VLKAWVEYALDLIEKDKPSLLAFQAFLDYLTKEVDNKEYFLYISTCWRAAHSKVLWKGSESFCILVVDLNWFEFVLFWFVLVLLF
jgi:hypothetical protein